MGDNTSECTPPSTTEVANVSSLNLLPKISREKYELVYKQFMDWRRDNKINSSSEKDVVTYFEELSKKVKPSTLWALYSMLRSTLSAKQDINIAFYPKLRAFLKRQSEGYKPKTSKTLTSKQIQTFIKEASDHQYLLIKVALVIGITGACNRNELCRLNVNDMEDLGSSLLVKIPDSKTENSRRFTITKNPYEICKKYINLRPPNLPEQRFFLNYVYGKCTRQVVGVNKIGSMAKQMASFLKLPNPELYTARFFRRSTATDLLEVEESELPNITTSPCATSQTELQQGKEKAQREPPKNRLILPLTTQPQNILIPAPTLTGMFLITSIAPTPRNDLQNSEPMEENSLEDTKNVIMLNSQEDCEKQEDTIHSVDVSNFKIEPTSPTHMTFENDPLASVNEYQPDSEMQSHCETPIFNQSVIHDDVFDAVGKNVAHKLRGMSEQQRIISEKIIGDVLYRGQMEMLSFDAHLALYKSPFISFE